jgi:hypothetical protein
VECNHHFRIKTFHTVGCVSKGISDHLELLGQLYIVATLCWLKIPLIRVHDSRVYLQAFQIGRPWGWQLLTPGLNLFQAQTIGVVSPLIQIRIQLYIGDGGALYLCDGSVPALVRTVPRAGPWL